MRLAATLVVGLVVLPFAGCKNGRRTVAPPPAAQIVSIAMTLVGDPTVEYREVAPGRFRTRVLVQYGVNGTRSDGVTVALTASDLVSSMSLDGSAMDNESLLSEEQLGLSTLVSLVLDGSYSMTQHQPPAFEPMKAAARRTAEQLKDEWTTRGGTFNWGWMWFDDYLCYPDRPALVLSNLSLIPTPSPGNATRLFGAVARMLDNHETWHETIANKPYERHFMIVLSDGADNVSPQGNENFSRQFTTPFAFRQFGFRSTQLTDISTKLATMPWLTVHMMGLGSQIARQQLEDISTAGRGRLFTGDSAGLDALFNLVAAEIRAITTQGADIPIVVPTPDKRLELTVRHKDNASATASKAFFIDAGPGARFLRFAP